MWFEWTYLNAKSFKGSSPRASNIWLSNWPACFNSKRWIFSISRFNWSFWASSSSLSRLWPDASLADVSNLVRSCLHSSLIHKINKPLLKLDFIYHLPSFVAFVSHFWPLFSPVGRAIRPPSHGFFHLGGPAFGFFQLSLSQRLNNLHT